MRRHSVYGGAQGRVGDARGVEFVHRPVILSAASRPEMSTGGTPTPGVVPQPASTTLPLPRSRLRGRNGPVCANVCASENGVPAASPRRAQSAGVISAVDGEPSPNPVSRAASSVDSSSSR